ncbi:uncharacterized protein N7484_009937 [Penicillium longicatenatum]|uniref:uncharacterized protein n=1 Tax=Penicillium longicatenatum TaxID=1561947 RepID=UPI002547AC1F|nr:uncharacterized protein N7484_009937 [Penicillium longicatenatum]KAJ5636624.1 hypothetical protein N7484_009937 [Penicillium longicatenatum]
MSFHSTSEGGNHSSSDNSPNGVPPAVPATAPRPSIDSASSRSCVTCRRRKVRCNKRSPCSNCVKTNVECVFPPPGRAPRKSKRPPDAELLSRLRRLEGVIQHLSDKTGEAGSVSSLSPIQTASSTLPSAAPTNTTANTSPPASINPKTSVDFKAQNGVCPFEDNDPKKLAPGKFENEFGRLVIEEGRSRYVSNRLWASLGDEVEELQDILDHSSSEEEDFPSPDTSHSGSQDGFLFGYHSLAHSLREYHPPLPKVSKFWEIYNENVAPLITILHKPTVRGLLIEAAQHPEALDKNSEALVFSIYLSAIVSSKPEDCLAKLGEDRKSAVKRYRFAVEQALARAGFLNTQSLVLLQAAILFLICIRREDDSKFVWSMDAIVLRLAQGLGLHRDGTNFALKPFETEMRRRLWWHICLMDIRSSEDHGTDPLIHESMYDTRLPLNINDDDLYPEMTETPTERECCTDMTFLLIRCEITSALRRANYTCPGSRFRMGDPGPSTERCERMIQIINNRVEERYIKHCDMNIPLHWAAATVARLILAKLWLIVHHPMTRKDRSTNVSQTTRESLFLTAIEVLEFGRLLETDPKTAKWGWLFRTNMQWHGVAFVLSEVCVRPICPVTDRAWNAIHALYSDWTIYGSHKKGMLWRPLDALMKRAAATRAKKQEELREKFGPNPQPSFNTTPDFATTHHHTLPQIHMPLDSPSISPGASRQLSMANDTGSIDLSNGPWGALRSIFPDTNILAPATADNPPMADPVTANILPTGLSFNSPMGMSNEFMTQDNITEPAPLNWEEWDSVMREFQMDVENDTTTAGNVSSVTGWFA